MNANEVSNSIKISCGCNDGKPETTSAIEAVKAANGPGTCDKCGQKYLISTKFTGGFKK